MEYRKRRIIIRMIMIALTLVMVGTMAAKLFLDKYSLESMVPQDNYNVSLHMSFTGSGEDVIVRTFLPKSSDRQTIYGETVVAEDLNFSRENTVMYERGDWSRENAEGRYEIEINYNAQIKPLRYNISPQLLLPSGRAERLEQYLAETSVIQVSAPEVTDLARNLAGDEQHLLPVLRKIYEYAYRLGSKPFKGTTDALTAFRLQEASCNGKSRLFVALVRNLGIPARLVGGLILNNGSKRTSHQWAEVQIGGYWVPFDTLNGHFGRLPNNYLTLYFGDEVLFRHSRNIGFDYRFDIRKKVMTNSRLSGFLDEHSVSFLDVFRPLLRGGFSLGVLQFLLVIPFGVLLVVVFKNVIGFNTFGTFLPALMAMAVQGMGLGAGLLAFVLVLALTVVLRYLLELLGLLHTPKLAIMMLGVIISLISLSALSMAFHWEIFSALYGASLFPIAILTITSERIALTISEEGLKKTVLILFQTLVAMSACYLIMSSVALQALVVAFPELLFGVLVLNLWVGSWTGIRVLEFYRFRTLIFRKGDSSES